MIKKIIAEIGSTHDGSFGNAQNLISEIKECGADIVKLQLHLPDYEMLPNAPNPKFFTKENRHDYFLRTNFSIEQYNLLKEKTESLGMDLMVSPFSEKAIELLEQVNIKYYKVASGEVTNLRLLQKLKKTGKEIFLSTGMSNWNEIDNALEVLGIKKTTIMQCTSLYPCPVDFVGLNIIPEMLNKYKIPVGFSDHFLGCEAGFSAAVLGASVIEKHVTFSRKMYGSDAPYAMELDEFKKYVKGLRLIWKMLDKPINKNEIDKFKDMKKVFEKSIVTSRRLKKGKVIQISDLSFKKPGTGINASKYRNIIGKKLKNSLEKNIMIKLTDLE